ncbi:MAG: hypothetical protein RLZZ230_46 [Candidatus Parcubacteria bacterium]|jgi:disulfide bond formation protein DsbB
MSDTVQTLNFILALGGISVLLVSSIILVDLYTSREFEKIIKVWGMTAGFLFTLGSSIMTLVYSEGFGFIPCGLCWTQRVFLYPQVFILGMAIFYKEKVAARYGLLLSIPGLIVALYQHYLQMGGNEFIACPTSGGDCAKRFMFEFGFVTFPLLSAFLFGFMIVLYIYILKTRTE